VYGLRDGDECRNAQQRAINIYQHIVLGYFGKSVGMERMLRGFFILSTRLECAPNFLELLRTGRQN